MVNPGSERPRDPEKGEWPKLADVELDYGKVEAILGKPFDYEHAVDQLLPYYAAQARLAADTEALSYRKFHVGAAVHAIDEERKLSGVFYGANTKESPDAPKRCAERDALEKALKAGYKKVI